MGNNSSVYEELGVEFNRLKTERKTNYIVLEDILKFKLPLDYPIDISHLGTLFALDKTKDGKFFLEEIIDFAAVYSDKQIANPGAADFVKEFQGYCSIQMWNQVSRPQGDQLFVNWFAELVSRGNTVELPKYPSQVFVSSETIRIIHGILNIAKTYGVDYMPFFNLMQRTGEELKYMDDNDEVDDLVPVSVVRLFAKDFIDGFISYMLELGFETDMEIL